MLQDKDRIFKNLYGLHGWRLPAARARGAWDGTKDMIARGHEAVIEEVKAFATRRRGRLSDRPQMVVHAEGRSASELSRRQRRRVRARYVQGPRDHAARPATSCRRRHAGLAPGYSTQQRPKYLFPRRVHRRTRDLEAAVAEAYEAKLVGKNNVNGWDFDIYVCQRRRRLSAARPTATLESLRAKRASRA